MSGASIDGLITCHCCLPCAEVGSPERRFPSVPTQCQPDLTKCPLHWLTKGVLCYAHGNYTGYYSFIEFGFWNLLLDRTLCGWRGRVQHDRSREISFWADLQSMLLFQKFCACTWSVRSIFRARKIVRLTLRLLALGFTRPKTRESVGDVS